MDVNRLRSYPGIENPNTCQENEVIFPMNRNCIVDIYRNLTPLEFFERRLSETRGLSNE